MFSRKSKSHLETETYRRTHTADKVHECDVCKKRFTLASNLVIHKRTHTGERPYECDVCNKRFTSANNLVTHKRTHTGENLMNVMFVTKDLQVQATW